MKDTLALKLPRTGDTRSPHTINRQPQYLQHREEMLRGRNALRLFY